MGNDGRTHWATCATEGGYRHYACAVARIRRLEAENEALWAALAGVVTEDEVAEWQDEQGGCNWNCHSTGTLDNEKHADDCPLIIARQVLAGAPVRALDVEVWPIMKATLDEIARVSGYDGPEEDGKALVAHIAAHLMRQHEQS